MELHKAQTKLLNSKTSVLMFGGIPCGYKTCLVANRNSYSNLTWLSKSKQTKLLQSKSKQSRLVKVRLLEIIK